MIIGLTGLIGSGKDTVADYLVERYDFEKLGFASLLKQAIANLFDIPVVKVDEMKRYDDGDVYVNVGFLSQNVIIHLGWRKFIQRFGTEMGRCTFGENFWVDMFWKNAPVSNIVIPDCRFTNEAQSILNRSGQIFQVERLTIKPDDDHPSEAGIPEEMITASIPNNHTKDELYRRIEIIMEAWYEN